MSSIPPASGNIVADRRHAVARGRRPPAHRNRPPGLGEHTDEVLGELAPVLPPASDAATAELETIMSGARERPMADDYTVADLVAEFLAACRVPTVFGVASVHNLPLLDAVGRRNAIRFVMARGEMGAAHMADGFARASGALGVVISSTGPGAANAVGGLVEARIAGTPVLHIASQTITRLLDRRHGHGARCLRSDWRCCKAVSKTRLSRRRSPQQALGVLTRAAVDALTPPARTGQRRNPDRHPAHGGRAPRRPRRPRAAARRGHGPADRRGARRAGAARPRRAAAAALDRFRRTCRRATPRRASCSISASSWSAAGSAAASIPDDAPAQPVRPERQRHADDPGFLQDGRSGAGRRRRA